MIKDGHISTSQLVSIISIVVLGKGLDSASLILIHWGHAAAELLVLVAELTMLAVMALLIPLMKAQDKNLLDLVHDLFGPWVGTALSIVLYVFLLADVALNLQFDMEQIKTVFLPTTPLGIILFLTILGMTVPMFYGIENLGRTNLIMMAALLSLAFVLIPLSIPQSSTANLPSILGPGIPTLLKEGVLHAGFFGEYIAILMLRPYVRSYERFRLGYWLAASLCLVLGVVAMLDTQLVFPYPTDDHLFFPFVESARLLYFGRFVQHIEAVFAVTWLVIAMARLSILIYILSLMSASIARAGNYRRFAPLTAAALYYGALIIPSLAYAIDFKDIVLEKRGLPFYGGIAVLVAAVGHFKRWRQGKGQGGAKSKGGQAGDATQNRQPKKQMQPAP